jgi:hypothetical protein
MDKDEALDLALEELENCADLLKVFEAPLDSCVGAAMLGAEKAITAIKQARALDKKAENARELGLDYEPAPVQPVAWMDKYGELYKEIEHVLPTDKPLYTTPPAAQRQWVGLTDAEVMQTMSGDWTSQFYFARAIEAKLKEKNDAAQPAVPDALNPKDENPAYAAGWNDCRAEMLRGMKPCETR